MIGSMNDITLKLTNKQIVLIGVKAKNLLVQIQMLKISIGHNYDPPPNHTVPGILWFSLITQWFVLDYCCQKWIQRIKGMGMKWYCQLWQWNFTTNMPQIWYGNNSINEYEKYVGRHPLIHQIYVQICNKYK